MKKLIEFDLDGQPVYFEAESSDSEGSNRTFRGGGTVRGEGDGETEKSNARFADAIARVRPAADLVLKSFRELSSPDEIGLEFGLKFNAKAGMVFASADSESTFKISLKWTKEKKPAA